MKTYIVGGAVRDALLGMPVQDRDHVVIGATPEEMLQSGYTPVGKDFPVFLHPVTHEEYALARTERKTAPGYKGFVFHASPDIGLEEDLIRRDLTINAMAQAEDGSLIDPFGGQRDLKARLFRHVSPAFAEDPLRILRVARFAARFADFQVASETNALMRQMAMSGEVDALVPERVWQELSRGLMEEKPSRMFGVLRECDALPRILPELAALWAVPQPGRSEAGDCVMRCVDFAAALKKPLPIRFAVLTHGLGNSASQLSSSASLHAGPSSGPETASTQQVEQLCRRLKIPNDCRDLAVMTARELGNIGRALEFGASEAVALLERCDAFRKPQRFADMLAAAECAHASHCFGSEASPPGAAILQSQRLMDALAAAQAVDAGEVASAIARHSPGKPQMIAEAVRAARIEAAASKLADRAPPE